MDKAIIINTQWLFSEPALIIGETKHQYIVSCNAGKPVRFWKKNGYQLGYSKILRCGEPDRLIIGESNG